MVNALETYNLPEIHEVSADVYHGRVVRDGYQRGWGLQYGNLREEILSDPVYNRGLRNAEGRLHHFSEPNRMNIYLLLKFFLPRIPFGHIIEFGSFRGGSAIFMATVCQELAPSVKIYALDTFEGMPLTDKRVDAHNKGDFSDTTFCEVAEKVKTLNLTNIKLIKGMFEKTTDAVLAEAGTISLVHIDCDIYSACTYARTVVTPSLVKGGYVVFDDATVSSCIGATEAVEQMIRETGIFSEQIWPQFVFRHGL